MRFLRQGNYFFQMKTTEKPTMIYATSNDRGAAVQNARI